MWVQVFNEEMRIHIGCSGWFYSHWRGLFYPPQEVSTKNWFAYYANVFDTVELNAPFYRWPTAATVRRWKRDAPPNFIYSVKVNQRITHEMRLVRAKRLVREYSQIASTLGEKLGCLLFQFPPSHHFSPSRLKSIATALDPMQRNVVEFRHRSWWREVVYRTLAEHQISLCAISAPRLPEVVVPNQSRLYVRLSGKTRWYRHDYSMAELQLWAERIRTSGAEDVWVYFNNDREGFAIKNALRLRRILRGIAIEETGESHEGSSAKDQGEAGK